MFRQLIPAAATLLLASPLALAQEVDEDDAALMRELGVKPLFDGPAYDTEAMRGLHPNITPTIPMDPDDPVYDAWKLIRDNLSEGREPGPIDIQRMPFGFGFNGIPTFFRLPVALTPEDLKAGDVDVAFLGAHVDMGMGHRGASQGPNALRASAGDYLSWGLATMSHMGTLVNPFREMKMVDYGDAPVDPLSTDRTNEAVRHLVREITEVERSDGSRVIPFIIGGDHSLAYPDIAGVTDVYGKGNVSVVHFDAHYDATMWFGHLASHGSWVKRLIHEGHIPGRNWIQVGLRGYYPDADSFEWMREEGMRYHTMAEVERRGWDAVLEDVIKEANEAEYLFISWDVDVMDPAYVRGTGTPEPGGLHPREAFTIMRRLCAESNVIGVDIVELAPERDQTYLSTMNVNRVIRECLVGIAMRKTGLTDEHYLSPLTTSHGRGSGGVAENRGETPREIRVVETRVVESRASAVLLAGFFLLGAGVTGAAVWFKKAAANVRGAQAAPRASPPASLPPTETAQSPNVM